MRNKTLQAIVLTVLWGSLVAAQALGEGCFHSAREAASGAGVRDGEGFRLEGIQVDRLAGGSWATVRSCLHPERPGQVLKLVSEARTPAGSAVIVVSASAPEPARTAPLRPRHELAQAPVPADAAVLVKVGAQVRVVRLERNARLEMAGVAQADGGLGARVRVRLSGGGDGSAERFADAVVRGAGLVELEAAQ